MSTSDDVERQSRRKSARRSLVKNTPESSSFHVLVVGQIESASFPSHIDNLYCRYIITHGEDWSIVHGTNSGLSQIACRQDYGEYDRIIWNFPIDIALKSTNAFGWPRIALSLYGLDFLGRDVVRGYGSTLIPLSSGRSTKTVQTYVPISGNICDRIANWISGTAPEFYDSTFTTQSDGRSMIKVRSEGEVQLTLDVKIKDMDTFGFKTKEE